MNHSNNPEPPQPPRGSIEHIQWQAENHRRLDQGQKGHRFKDERINDIVTELITITTRQAKNEQNTTCIPGEHVHQHVGAGYLYGSSRAINNVYPDTIDIKMKKSPTGRSIKQILDAYTTDATQPPPWSVGTGTAITNQGTYRTKTDSFLAIGMTTTLSPPLRVLAFRQVYRCSIMLAVQRGALLDRSHTKFAIELVKSLQSTGTLDVSALDDNNEWEELFEPQHPKTLTWLLGKLQQMREEPNTINILRLQVFALLCIVNDRETWWDASIGHSMSEERGTISGSHSVAIRIKASLSERNGRAIFEEFPDLLPRYEDVLRHACGN